MNKALVVSDYAIIIVGTNVDEDIMKKRLVDCIRMVNYSLMDRILLVVDDYRNGKYDDDRGYDWIREVIRKESMVEFTYDILYWNSFDKLNDWIKSLPVKKDIERLASQPVRVRMLQTVYAYGRKYRQFSYCLFKVLSGIVHQGQDICFNTNNGEKKFKVNGHYNYSALSNNIERPKVFLPGQIFCVANCLMELIPEDSCTEYKHFISGNYYSEMTKKIKVDSFWIEYTHFGSNNISKEIFVNRICLIFCNSKLCGRIERIKNSEGKGMRIEIKVFDRVQSGHDRLFSQHGFLTTFEKSFQFGRVLLGNRKEMIGFGKVISVIYQDMDTNTLLIEHPISLFSKIPKHLKDIHIV
ncbi:predicted protein [Naegleria gruberi]|uniref:Predicted protein n=1 Tax=Naegleria gruberi TaxID=5762 RepID=D2V967_NAEGR|nr:uncharacterized protein NAEGRDRAFT_65582 [Naegleria gruberi]EFC46536.1 predicted protein [Naegleria gruberi]|eukprot:XP_002679280.1 predicted protein [Naegleria gruberi strain NEG-M]